MAYSQVQSWEDFRDAIAAGYPVLFCSRLSALNATRDADGFVKTEKEWNHAWLGAGIDDTDRPGACLINSFGPDWASGPKRHNQPDGSVWIDAKIIDYHCRKSRDSYALSLYKGFPKPEERYILW